jgi:hypothetical protein
MKFLKIPIAITLILSMAMPACAATRTLKDLARKGGGNEVTKGCPGHLVTAHGTDRAAIEKSLAKEISDYRSLAEHALALRAETIKVGRSIKEKMERGKPLSGEDLDILNQGIVEHLKLREALLAMAESHECWLDASDKDLAKLGITPETRLKGIMLSLSAALVLYDNYLLSVSLFEGDHKLRRLLNERDPGYAVKSAALAKVTLNYNSIGNRQRVRKAIKFYDKESQRQLKMFLENSDMDYINLLIAQSPSYTMVKKWSPFYVIGRKLGFMGTVTTDTVAGFERDGVSLFSMVFGNAVGLVETRKGKLYGQKEIINEIKGSLRAGDILLEKTPFRLTDKLIPGYWGHAAVWIGGEAELKELGIWDNPVVARYRDEIRAGKQVVEALRSGVEMNSLEHFFNIDSFGALRKPDSTREHRAKIVIQALRQVGKPYDFNFDVESKERVYCSKLVYMSYSGIEWPTKKSLGRTTFTPDDVAIKAAREGLLQVVTFYHDGSRISDNPQIRMAELMNLPPEKKEIGRKNH